MMKNNFNTSSGVYKVKTFGTIQSIEHFVIWIVNDIRALFEMDILYMVQKIGAFSIL